MKTFAMLLLTIASFFAPPAAAKEIGCPTPSCLVTLSTNVAGTSATRMTVLNNGNVGIGTTSPGGQFEVHSGSNYARLDATSVPTLRLFNIGVATANITADTFFGGGSSALIDTPWVAPNIISKGTMFSELASTGSDFGPGVVNLWSEPGTANFVSFNERGVSDNGALGFLGGSTDLVYKSGTQGLTSGTERFRVLSSGRFGIGTSSPTATLGVAGPIATALSTKTADYTLTDSDSIIVGDATSGPITLTLPTAVGRTGVEFKFKKVDSSANSVVVATTSGQTIDGASSYIMPAQYAAVVLVSDNTQWLVLGSN